MKFKFLVLLILFLSIFTTNSQSKEYRINRMEASDINITPRVQFILGNDTIYVASPLKKYVDELLKLESKKKNENEILFTSSSLNYLFSKKLEAVFNTSNDLSLQKAYFNMDASDNSFSLGYNFDNRKGDPLKRLNWVYSVGFKLASKNGFATIPINAGDQKSNLGFNGKISFIKDGYITYNTKNGPAVQIDKNKSAEEKIATAKDIILTRREFLFFNFNEKIKKFNASDDLKKKVAQLVSENNNIDSVKSKVKKFLEKKSDDLYYEMITEEITNIESDKLYSSIFKDWLTWEFYLAFGSRQYAVLPITNSNKATNVNYYPFNTSLSYNFYLQESQGFSIFFKATGALKTNNNIEVNGTSEKEFQSVVLDNGVPILTNPVTAFDEANFTRFLTRSVSAQLTLFFLNNTIGISGAYEKNFGKFSGYNWMLGVPLSLKDKEGKPKVNFEFQLRDNETFIERTRVFGLSTSFFFEDLLN